MKTIALYAGSFDPFTNGHLNIVQKAARLFDTVYVLIANNKKKQRTFPIESMVYPIQKTFYDLELNNCFAIIAPQDAYTVDIANELGAQYLIRGLRGDEEEFVYEEQIASFNKNRNSNIETIYIRGDDNEISSSFVRDCFLTNSMKEIEKTVPTPVYEFLKGEKYGT